MALGEAFLAIKGEMDEAQLLKAAKRALKLVERELPKLKVKAEVEASTVAAKAAISGLAVTAAKTATKVALSFDKASKAIARDFIALERAGATPLENLTATGERAARDLAAAYGLAADDIPPAFKRAGTAVAESLAAASAAGTKSLTGLSAVAAATAGSMSASLGSAATAAGATISGALTGGITTLGRLADAADKAGTSLRGAFRGNTEGVNSETRSISSLTEAFKVNARAALENAIARARSASSTAADIEAFQKAAATYREAARTAGIYAAESARITKVLDAQAAAANRAAAATAALKRAGSRGTIFAGFFGASATLDETTNSVKKLDAATEKLAKRVQTVSFNALKSGLTGVRNGILSVLAVSAAVGIGSIFKGLQGASDVQSLTIRFTALRKELKLGKGTVDEFVQSLRDISLNTGLDTKVLADGVARFTSFGLSGKQATAFTLRLADALSTTGLKGGELSQALATVQTQLSQSAGSGKLAGDELRSVLETLGGVVTRSQLIAQVAKDTGKSVADVAKDVNNGALKAADGLQALFELTGQDKFKGALEKQAKTLPGVIRRIFGTVQNALTDAFLPKLNGIADRLEAFLGTIKPQLKSFGDSFAASFDTALPAILKLVTDVLPKIPGIFTAITNAAVAVAPIVGKAFEGVQGAITALQGADLSGAFDSIKNLAPVALGIAQGLGAVVIALVNITAALEPITRLFSGAFGKALGQVIGLAAGFALVAKATLAFRAAIVAVGVAFDLTPLGAIVTIVGLLTLAFIKAYTSSQKFRDVVNGVFNTIVSTVAGAIKFMIGALVEWGLVGLRVIKGLLDAASHLPKWLGGGKFDTAAAAVGKIIDGVEALKNKTFELIDAAKKAIHINVDTDRAAKKVVALGKQLAALELLTPVVTVVVQIDTIVGQQNTALLQSKGIKPTGLEDASGFDPRLFGNIGKKVSKTTTDTVTSIKDAIDGGSGGSGSSGSGGSGGLSKAAQTAKDATEKISTAIKTLAKDLAGADVATIRDKLKEIKQSIRDIASGQTETKLIARINRIEKRLIGLARTFENVSTRLQNAADASKSAFEDALSSASITDAFDSITEAAGTAAKTVDLSVLRIVSSPFGSGPNIPGTPGVVTQAQATTASLVETLKARLKAIADFNTNLKNLARAGLNQQTLQQLVSAGVSGGSATAATLQQASAEQLKQINSIQAAITKAGKELGATAGAVAATEVGENVSLGIVAGLKKQEKALKAAMEHLGDIIVDTIKKRLKIKSPSQATGWVGKMTGAGLVNALHGSVPHIEAAADRMSKAAVPALDGIELPGLNTSPIGAALAKTKFAPITVDALLRLADSSALSQLNATMEAKLPARDAQQAADVKPFTRDMVRSAGNDWSGENIVAALYDIAKPPSHTVYKPTPPQQVVPGLTPGQVRTMMAEQNRRIVRGLR